MPWLIASMVTELITPLIPGAGPPPTSRAKRLAFASLAMRLTSSTASGAAPRSGHHRALDHRPTRRRLESGGSSGQGWRLGQTISLISAMYCENGILSWWKGVQPSGSRLCWKSCAGAAAPREAEPRVRRIPRQNRGTRAAIRMTKGEIFAESNTASTPYPAVDTPAARHGFPSPRRAASR